MANSISPDKVAAIVATYLGKSVDANTPLVSSKLLDSVTVLDIVVDLESAFSVNIPNKDVTEGNFNTVSAMVAYLNAKNSH